MRTLIKITVCFLIIFGSVWSSVFSSPLAPGTITGYVFNYYGLAVSGATVGIENGSLTLSNEDGYYIIEGITEGQQAVGCWKQGYNISWADVTVISADTVQQNFTLTQPAMVISPLIINQTLNPGEYSISYINILNTGTGPLNWQADIVYPIQRGITAEGGWLTLAKYQGEIDPFGGLENVATFLDASGTESGDVYEAEIVFASTPDVGEITVPVTMNVQGNLLAPPKNLSITLADPVSGRIDLSWSWQGDAFLFFLVRRDGSIIATTTSQSYTDILPDYGEYCYTVQAVYHEGSTTPAGPACIEWPNPHIGLNPENLEGWVWPGYTVDVFTTITNQGEGTLAFSFPVFAKGTGTTGTTGRDGGGPDGFGYIWLDSDEPGGPEFGFTDISTTGTPVYGISDDNIVGPYPVGFEFYFYGEEKSNFWINSNGCIGFSSNYITLGNTTIPTNSSVYKDFIAWMWDDMVFRPGISQVFYQSFDDKLIIQFKNYGHFGQENSFINAEAVLFRNGKVMLLYNNFGQGIPLDLCTVGIQSSNPEIGLQVAFNTAYLHNNLAVLFNIPGDFIIDVQPSSGTIPENSSQVITITYDSKQYAPGPYNQDLLLLSNDINDTAIIIENTMHVYLPGIYSGIVTDRDSDEPLNGALVTAGPFQTSTGENGAYNLYVDEGSYDLVFSKLGYMPLTLEDTVAIKGITTPADARMWDMNYSPRFVSAIANDEEEFCQVTWGLPNGPYEIITDDGEADDFFVYAQGGSWSAVKFTPSGYPATVIGGSFYVGDGSFPGPFLGTGFGVAVFDDDGPGGMPGTILDSTGVTVHNSGWVSLDWLNADLTEGSFYLAMYQSGNVPFAAPIGIDMDNPVFYRSYFKFRDYDWSVSPLQDFMIRAYVNGPESKDNPATPEMSWKYAPKMPVSWKKFVMTKSGEISPVLPGYEKNEVEYRGVEESVERDVTTYHIVRFSGFDPDNPPETGTATDLYDTTGLSYQDNHFDELPQGWYAYGIKALFTSGLYSDYSVSNVIGRGMDCQVTVNVTLSSGQQPVDAEITLKGMDYPYETYFAISNAAGNTVFDQVWKGNYSLKITRIGYDPYLIDSTYINGDKEFVIILSEKKYPPACLYVDSLSLIGTWCEPQIKVLQEDFEGDLFPPAGWQSMTSAENGGWIRGADGSSFNWAIPAWDTYYAYVNDDAAGSESDGCCDYLVTPVMDLRESGEFYLQFDSYYDGLYGELASVEYSTDAGTTWVTLNQLTPDTAWKKQAVDLAAICGETGPPEVWLAFHADDAGEYASGWAVDNVVVSVPAPAADYIDFAVFLDGALVGMTPEPAWDFAPLAYGQTYTASVAARYTSGLSEKDYYTFTSVYLFPPQNLVGDAPDDASILIWDPPGPEIPLNLIGYNIYRDGLLLDYLPNSGIWEPVIYIEKNMQPGRYYYTVTGVYDLTPYGHPGETGESMQEGPAIVTVDYCNQLEFLETWEMGSFEENEWLSDGTNWRINSMTGNPLPCVEFSNEPGQVDYTMALESYPMCAVGITEGSIWLHYDLALNSLQPTGEELLLTQVWNWEAHEWITVQQFSNIDGNFDWRPVRIDIGTYVMNTVFKIRFVATGSNSLSLRGWFIDNIHVFRNCPAPSGLEIDPYSSDGIRLAWQMPTLPEVKSGENANRELAGLYIYRSENGGEYQLLKVLDNVGEYIDPDSTLEYGSDYCYKLNAVWQSETDFCESMFTNEACITWTGLDNELPDNAFTCDIFPNPAYDLINIKSSSEINRITVYNNAGVIIADLENRGQSAVYNAAGLPGGIYLFRIITADASFTRLVSVLH